MEFHGILSRSKVPWNSMELFPHSRVPWNSMEFHGTFSFPQKSSMEFHGIPWNLINFIFKKIIFLNIVFGIWLMIRCYLAKISQKRYKLHWFQYRNSYFEHPSVSENGTRSAKMACCYMCFCLCENTICWILLHSSKSPILFPMMQYTTGLMWRIRNTSPLFPQHKDHKLWIIASSAAHNLPKKWH